MGTNKREQSAFSDAVARTVRAERAAARMTQAQMIEATGLSRSTLVRIESGAHVADTTEVAKICGALGLGLAEFFHRVESRLPVSD